MSKLDWPPGLYRENLAFGGTQILVLSNGQALWADLHMHWWMTPVNITVRRDEYRRIEDDSHSP